jgi:hypothetical protein
VSAIQLEPLGERHLAEVTALMADPDVLRFTRVPDPPTPEFPRRWLSGYEAGRREGFAALGADGAFLGIALAPSIEPAARELELGYIVAAGAASRPSC